MTDTLPPDEQPARFLWLHPPFLRPKLPMPRAHERLFLLVGIAALFAGYDMSVFGLALQQIQTGLHIPEDRLTATVSLFRLASFAALLLAYFADLVGRRRLLLITIMGQAIATLLTAFAADYQQFVEYQILTRIFGYAEEMLCFVVIVEEVDARLRGWSTGLLAAMNSTGAGIASLVFAFVNMLPFGWRAIYVIGALPLFAVAILRRRLPETKRFEARNKEVRRRLTTRITEALGLFRRLATEYPGRLGAIILVCSTYAFAVASAPVLMAKFLQQHFGYTPGEVTLLFVPGGFVALALSILAGRLSDRIGRKPVLMTTLLITAGGYSWLFNAPDGRMAAIAWIVAIFGGFTSDALVAGFALEIVPTAYRATVSGIRYSAGTLGGALGLLLEGFLYDYFNSHSMAVSALMGVVLVSVIAVLFLPEPAGRVLEDVAGGPDSEANPVTLLG
jgi:putative MFS transporter